MVTDYAPLFDGQLVVVETEEDMFLGVLDVGPAGQLRIRNGFRGHPHLLDPAEVAAITLASDHPSIED